MKKKALFIIIPFIIILSGIGIGGFYIYNNQINIDTIYPGVFINEYPVGNMTKIDALNYIKKIKEEEILSKNMNLIYEDNVYNIKLKDIEFTFDYNKAVEEAYQLGREGTPFQRYKEIKSIKKDGHIISLEPIYNLSKINGIVKNISQELYLESKDAQFNLNNGNIHIESEEIGREVDEKKLVKLIEENMDILKDIEIPINKIEPQYTKEYYSRINGIIGEYSTDFANSGAGRKKNIALSAKAFDGMIVHPGESVSFNETTGPRQKQFGYEEAPVIVGGEFTPGIGGGVCQTSTTLYNALLLADITILERHPHSIPPAYIKKGQDAAVATGYLDLRFRNDFDYPIYISSKVWGDRLYFYIYGDKKNRDYTISIQPEIIETIPYKVIEIEDSTMEPSTRQLVEQGRNGYKVKTYKSIIKNGTVIDRKQITMDYYKEKNYQYKVGPVKIEKREEVEETIIEEPILEEPEEPVLEEPIEEDSQEVDDFD